MQFWGFHPFLLANWRDGGEWSAILKWNGVEIFWSGLIQHLGKGKRDYKLSLLPNMCMAIVTNFTNKRFGTSWFCHYCQNVTHSVVTIDGHICIYDDNYGKKLVKILLVTLKIEQISYYNYSIFLQFLIPI